jgi:hypothetical protein
MGTKHKDFMKVGKIKKKKFINKILIKKLRPGTEYHNNCSGPES